MPIFFEIPAFMPLSSAAFWDSLFSKSHRTSTRRIAEITSILHARRCPESHNLSPSIKLRVHWIYPRKCGIFDTTRSRISSARQHRKALQIQEFSRRTPRDFAPYGNRLENRENAYSRSMNLLVNSIK